MNFKFQVGELVRVYQSDIGLITARRSHASAASAEHTLAEYTILIGGIPYMVWEHELTKAGE